MAIAWFRFYEELNDFLPAGKKKKLFPYAFSGNPSVKFAIEAQGVPHTEVDLVLVNGKSVDFSYRLGQGDAASVYPVFESFDLSEITHLREKPLRDPSFIADVHLGRLVKYMRLCGFDTVFQHDLADDEIIRIAEMEKRTILTRDRQLLKNSRVMRGYYIRSQNPAEQLKEVLLRFDLRRVLLEGMKPFSLCLACNGKLEAVSKESILSRLEPGTRAHFDEFWQCSRCGKVYWKGSHYGKMAAFLESVLQQGNFSG